MIWKEGLDGPQLKTLLPSECVHEARPDPAEVIPQRTLGALRRQLDKMAALWEVKHAELAKQAEVTAGAESLFASVMGEAKRIQHRKRLPSSDMTKDGVIAESNA
jgi:hypothetical protein